MVMAQRLDWQRVILPHAREIVESYDTGVTLRQLFYRLVADGTLPNTRKFYQRLSEMTAKARRAGTFPELLDRTSRIERWSSFDGPGDAMDHVMRYLYRRDRTAGQQWTVYLGVEKASLSEQLDAWFGDPLGVPILALGGYASQTLADEVRRDIARQRRPAVLIYAGDMDPTGIDVDRDFEQRVDSFDKVIRVALTAVQVAEYALPHNPDPAVEAKLERDPRAKRFQERHGSLVQYEVDALPPETLRNLYRTAVEQFWDADAHAATLAREHADLAVLRRAADSIDRQV
jgi:hypothetical protein